MAIIDVLFVFQSPKAGLWVFFFKVFVISRFLWNNVREISIFHLGSAQAPSIQLLSQQF